MITYYRILRDKDGKLIDDENVSACKTTNPDIVPELNQDCVSGAKIMKGVYKFDIDDKEVGYYYIYVNGSYILPVVTVNKHLLRYVCSLSIPAGEDEKTFNYADLTDINGMPIETGYITDIDNLDVTILTQMNGRGVYVDSYTTDGVTIKKESFGDSDESAFMIELDIILT